MRQSEPDGTCEKQENRSFSLSIRYVAKLARACPNLDLYCLESYFDFLQPLLYFIVWKFVRNFVLYFFG